MKEFIDQTPEMAGTPINRKNLLAMQGFNSKTIRLMPDNSLEIINSDNERLLIKFDNDKIIETLIGQKTITKTTSFSPESNSITEVMSEVIS